VIKSIKMSWAGYVHEREEGTVHAGLSLGNPREREHLEETDLVGRMMFKRIFKA
jgi:hypothetical protein